MDKAITTVLDVSVCSHSRGGVGRWIKGLSKGLASLNPNHVSVDIMETHPGVGSYLSEAVVLPPPLWMKLPLLRRFLLKHGTLESTRAARLEKCLGKPDILHLSGVQPYGIGRATVVTFFDDTPWTSPQSHTKQTLFYAERLKGLVEKGAAVLTISDWSASVAVRLFGVPKERICNAGGAADQIFSPGEPDPAVMHRYNISPRNYFLHVGSFVPRKNIPFLVNSFRIAGTTKKLVLAGAEKWGDAKTENAKGVVLLNDLTDDEILSLYRGAMALLFPSSIEGLGLPVLEAFACNTPVIASAGGALPETVGDSGQILPVLESQPWVKAIRDMASGKTTESLRALAESAVVPSWNDVAEKAMIFYRSLL